MSGEFVKPKFLTILAPLPAVKKHWNDGVSSDKPRTFRMRDEEYAVVVDAARALEITPAHFIRWVLYTTANEVLSQQHQQVKKR